MTEHKPNYSALKLLALQRPLIIGHRGICAHAPENTLPSFALAVKRGIEVIELDYHHSRDGAPMVIHDDSLDRTTDARRKWKQRRVKVANKTAAEIQTLDAGSWFGSKFAGARVPLLVEALDFICGHGALALVEHKSGGAATCVQLLRERNWINRVVVISFDWSWLRRFHELEPAQALGALGVPRRLADGRQPRRRGKQLDVEWLDGLAATGASLAVWNRQVSGPAIQVAHRRGLKVWVYTVDDPRRAARLVELGVDGIITNDPARLLAHGVG